MGVPGRRRDDGSGWYWRIRIGLELVKTGLWVVFHWLRSGGPFGPLH
ncbi:hypothetical protein Arub01_40320 [Actinomadura rubrobrunea]|uniref:Uncharacterized protein n=1 Tax=Actinomadura rubrobrunea TaxID=115335 RepID=A0A9W6PZG1_9ACTN|nr:hypothetical protein [Actinomadura rubrobrunea]GLW65788.1 hypothetical protein Arub01_40320 [Actinomadura rubrobrunea]